MVEYPDKKQIQRKTDDFVRTLRLYIRGICPAYTVKNQLQCLFTDLFLEISKQDEEKAVNCHFPRLWKEMR